MSPLRSLMNIRKSEIPFAALMGGQFFFIILSFWMLKPLKKGLFVELYDSAGFHLLGWHMRASQAELLAKVLNVAVAFGAMALFSWLSRRLRRQELTVALLGLLQLGYVAFSLVLPLGSGPVIWGFYVFGDLFNMLMVASFFAFLADSVNQEQAKRLYGLVVLGGVLGGVVGSTFVRAAIGALEPWMWMWAGFGIGVLIGGFAIGAGLLVDRRPVGLGAWKRENPAPAKSAAACEGILLVLKSRYLLSIAAIVGLYEIVSTLVDFQFTETVSHYLDGPSIREHFSTVYLVTNGLAVCVQLLGTGFIMSRLGVARALLVLPAAILMGSAGFIAIPALWAGSFLSIADNGLNYSINQSAREALYVPRDRSEKYRAKAFIDMVVQRFAKAGGVLIGLALSVVFVEFGAIRWLSLAIVLLVLVWMAAARYAGKRFEPPAREEPGEGVGDAEGA